MMRYQITQRSGALVRRQVRRELQRAGVTFREDKGLLDSQFLITGLSEYEYTILLAWFRSIAND